MPLQIAEQCKRLFQALSELAAEAELDRDIDSLRVRLAEAERMVEVLKRDILALEDERVRKAETAKVDQLAAKLEGLRRMLWLNQNGEP